MLKKLSQVLQKKIKLINLHIAFILFISNAQIFKCENACLSEEPPSIINSNCFNNILKFNDKKYKSGNFATNKNGDILIEFYEDNETSSSRLFYGLTKDGKYYFSNQPTFTKKIDINSNEISGDYGLYQDFGIHNSLNLFVSLKNEPNKDNQYLFSINPFYSIVELFNLDDNNKNNNYYVWNFNNFFNINEDDYDFLYEYVLYEVNKDNSYIIIFIPKCDIYDEIVNLSFIKKFRFNSFAKETYEEVNSITFEKYLNSRIINTFFMDEYDYNILVVLSCFEKDYEENDDDYAICSEPEIVKRRVSTNNYSPTINLKFNFNFYKYNLKSLNYANGMEFYSYIKCIYYNYPFEVYQLFIKSIYLGNQYTIFAYTVEDEYSIYFELIKMNYLIGMKKIEPIKWGGIELNYFNNYETLNDFVKIDDKRVVFVYSTS